MSASEIATKLFSECGVIAVLFSIAVVWLAAQLAKERAARETDRATALATIDRYSKAYENVIVSNAELKGMLAARHEAN